MRVTTAGTNENLLRLVSVPGHGARVLPLKLVRPVPGHGAQICARAPTKGYVQTGARARFNEPDMDLPKETHLIQSVLFSAHNKNV